MRGASKGAWSETPREIWAHCNIGRAPRRDSSGHTAKFARVKRACALDHFVSAR